MKKIGLLTSGGDCQGLNSAIKAVMETLYKHYNQDIEIYGILDGFKGLIEGNYYIMNKNEIPPLLRLGGTILGTSRQPYKSILESRKSDYDKVRMMKNTYKELGLDCLVVLGGNGTHKTANLLYTEGLNLVSLPKTIDNDIFGTDMTFGFNSALNVATNAIDCIRTTAMSHKRIFIVEVMGHKVGWLTLYSGIASGCDIILIPEIPYKLPSIIKSLNNTLSSKSYAILAVAEGAISYDDFIMPKSQRKMATVTASQNLAVQLQTALNKETRVSVLGHIQRGGDISAYDRIFTSRLGAFAADLIINKDYGKMAALKGDKIVSVPLSEVSDKLKYVPKKSQIVEAAKSMGICFGD